MPELPEVETICRGLTQQIISKKISKIIIKKPNLVKQTQASFRRVLINSSFIKIDRIGKLLIFKIDNTKTRSQPKHAQDNKYLLIHLKMTGQLVYCDNSSFVAGGHANSKKEEEQFLEGKKEEFCKPGRFTHIVFELEGRSKKENKHRGRTSMLKSKKIITSRLFFNDMRQFGYLKIVDQMGLKEIKSKFGIEPGQSNFTFTNFQKALKNRKANIKATLLNQAIISGLGNIYVDEVLFSAKIHPQRQTKSLTNKEQKLLFNAIKRIIKLAIKNKGTTFSDFIDNEGRKGNFSQKLKVYGQQNKNCPRCYQQNKNIKVKPLYYPIIQKIKVTGRGTHFCPICQKI